MKLSWKIFFGICIPAIIAILLISEILINISFNNNIENEMDRCVQEFRIIEENIDNSIKTGSVESEIKDKYVVETYADYYKTRGIDFLYYEDGNFVYKSADNLQVNNSQLFNISDQNISTVIEKIDGEYYLFIGTRMSNNNILVYTRNISNIYRIRNYLIVISTVLIVLIICLIAIIAYKTSKKLTKPLVEMQKQMTKVSKGDYNVNLKEGKNEIGTLAKNFNQMSKELEKRNNELIEMVNSKQLFIDNLSHEINTPLTSIIGYAELLEKANCDEEQKIKFLKNIQNDANRINDIHKKLLLLSYKEKADFETQLNSSNEIFDKVRDSVKFKLEEHKINLIINDNLNKIFCDETLIIMCISNLISNAINASKDGRKITINAYEKNNNAIIEVIDEGQGISKENIEKIVEPFYRVDKSRSRKNGGAGLGLAMCKKIMELHKGKLKIESELGVGSCFTIEFPNK